MTEEFQKMLPILASSVFDTKFHGLSDDEYEKVLSLAKSQGVFPLVYGALSKNAGYTDLKWDTLFIKTLAYNEKQKYCLRNILKKMDEAGLECAVLKGASLAVFYSMPECRVSGDIDLYIHPKDEKQVKKLLSDMGMIVLSREEGGHHFEAHDKNGGLIEVHTSLYSHNFGQIVLKGRFNTVHPFTDAETKDGLKIKTLSLEDNLYFLTAHLIKHFVKEGCGIRQITDLLAYINHYKDSIDFNEYFKNLKELKFDALIKNILGIGVKYFSMTLPVSNTELSDDIISDVERGGNFGFGEEERRGFYENFLKKRSASMDEFNRTRKKNRTLSIIKSVFFPGRTQLIKKGYTYLNRSAGLYPIAYLHRIANLVLRLGKKERKISDLKYTQEDNETIRGRMELMNKLDIL